MVSIILQLVGLACLLAFAYVVWPPSVLALAGIVLVFGPELADRRR